jgi:hypothetical protein
MNLLDQSGLKGSLENNRKIIHSHKQSVAKKNFSPKDKNKFFSKKNNYKNLIIISLFLFFIFFLSVFSKRENFNSSYDYTFLSLTNMLTDNEDLYIKSLSIKDNSLLIIAEANKQKDIYRYLPKIEEIFPDIRLKIDTNIYQIWIKHKIQHSSIKSIDEIFSMIDEIDGLLIEKEIIGQRLVAICSIDDFNIIFNYFDKIKLLNFEFSLELIHHISKNRYYNLTMKI